MNRIIASLMFIACAFSLHAQESNKTLEGTISYITSQNVYVKFESTQDLAIGDTLFSTIDGKQVPVLKILNKSSISCVCEPISTKPLSVSDKLYAQPNVTVNQGLVNPTIDKVVKKELPNQDPQKTQATTKTETIRKPDVFGMMSAAYSTVFSSQGSPENTRAQYTFMLNARNIDSSRVSFESYITAIYRQRNWDTLKTDIFNVLKIYNLAVGYEAGKNSKVWLGRRMNPRISNMGAVDGLQFEQKMNSLTLGIVAGLRPDYTTYGFNSNLLQYGGYLSFDKNLAVGSTQNTLAFIEQRNSGAVDRRYAYVQHSSMLGKKLSLFGSAELDLFNKTLNSLDSSLVQSNSPKLTNLYASIRYKLLKPLSLSLSYSSRKNVVYYETFKTFLEQLLDDEKQQGYSLQLNFHPKGIFSMGVTASYRNRDNDPKASKNLYSYITLSQLPRLNISTTLSATLIETAYLSGRILSLGVSKDLVKAKLSTGVDYRFIDYSFTTSDQNMIQHIGEWYLTWRLYKKLSLSCYYEGSFDTDNTSHRVYAQMRLGF